MSFTQFQQYCDDHSIALQVKTNLVEKIKCLIVKSCLATRKIIDPNKRRNCFELFGYDFIIDEDLNVWLIEVNTNPCIEESSTILKILLPRMIDDMLKITVDSFFSDSQQ
jgi:D-alanine-D-alanine ligase-like ATP-grasp enzyme